MLVLSGDVGGTNTRLQLTEFDDDKTPKVIKKGRFKNNEYSDFIIIINDFLNSADLDPAKVISSCFGVAGPIIDQNVKLTNLSWVINSDEIKNHFGWNKVKLLNDFVIVGYGLDSLSSKGLLSLQQGKPKEYAPKAYIGAGTGLGMGFVSYDVARPHVYPTEGGHIDFAPTSDLEIEFLKFLRQHYQHASFERVLSGMGITNIYQFLRSRKDSLDGNNELNNLIDRSEFSDLAPFISKFAFEHGDPLALEALNLFVSIYGAAAGNLALTTLPFGGLYIAGGIAPKLLELFKKPNFINSFVNKGRASQILQDIPVSLVLDTEIGLNGAAFYAVQCE